MALGAPDGLAHPDGAHGTDAVGEVARLVVLLLGATLLGGQEQAVEARGHAGLGRGVGQQVAGKLLAREPVEGLVVVEGPQDVVAVGPDVPGIVGVVADRVGEAHDVEPADGHALAVLRRGQEAVDQPLVGAGRGVGLEGGDEFRGRGQAREVEAQAAGQRPAVGLGRGLQPVRLQVGADQPVDGSLARVAGRHRGPHQRLVGPVALVLGTLGDPALEQGLLDGRERLVGLGRRHQLVRIGAVEAMHQFTAGSVSGHDGLLAGLGRPERLVPEVEPQATLHLLHIGPVAREAVLGEDRPDVAVEPDVGRSLGLGRGRGR